MTIPPRFALSLSLLALTTACTKGSFQGKLVDGITGAPLAESRVLLKAETTDFTCMVFEATTDANGAFSVADLCADTTYKLHPGDETLFFTEAPDVDGSVQATGSVDIKTWRAPGAGGVFLLTGADIKPQRTYADIKTATILDTQQVVRYPETQPKDDNGWPKVPAGSYLVLVGKGTIEEMELLPVIESPEVKFAPDREDIKHFSLGQPWHYIGIEMRSQTDYEVKTVQIDASKVIDATAGDRMARYIPADAVPAGKYALLRPKDRRTYMFRFGGEAAAPAPAE